MSNNKKSIEVQGQIVLLVNFTKILKKELTPFFLKLWKYKWGTFLAHSVAPFTQKTKNRQRNNK